MLPIAIFSLLIIKYYQKKKGILYMEKIRFLKNQNIYDPYQAV